MERKKTKLGKTKKNQTETNSGMSAPPSLFPELWEYIASHVVTSFQESHGGVEDVLDLAAFQGVCSWTRRSVGAIEAHLVARFLRDDSSAWVHELTDRTRRMPKGTDQTTLVGRLKECARTRIMLEFLEDFGDLHAYIHKSSMCAYRSPRYPHPCTCAFMRLVEHRVKVGDKSALLRVWEVSQLEAVVSAMKEACSEFRLERLV